MAVSAVMAAISTASVAMTTGAYILGSALTHFLISTAMGAALNALSPKPKVATSSRGYSINGESGSALDHQIIYGTARVGGVRIYDTSTGTNNNFLHRIMAFAGHEITSYDQIYLNDEVVTIDGSGNVTSPARYNGYVRIKRYYGTAAQTADADLIADTASSTDGKWTSNHRLRGIAYVYVRFQYDADVFPNGIPVVSATIRGRKVYDPRTGLTVFSNNPALCMRDYLTAPFGFAQPSSRISDTQVTTAANVCDELVSGNKRYTCDGSFVTSFAPNQVLSDLLTSMGGLLWYSQGKWRMKAAKYVTPTITLSESDLRSGISLSTRHSRRANFNTIKGTFKGAESDWQEADYPSITDSVYLTADNNIVSTLDFPLPYTTSSVTAQRIANIALRRNREQLTFSASFGLAALAVEVGDFVYINNTRFGWSSKPFEVTNWSFGLVEGLDLQIQMTLREIDPDVFTSVSPAVFENNNTNLPSAFYTEPLGLTLTSEVRVVNENVNDVIVVNVTATQPVNVERVEVQYKRAVDSIWNVAGVGDLGSYEIIAVDSTGLYDIRVRSYSYLGVKSDWVYYNGFQPIGLMNPPANVANFNANVNGGTINLGWDAVPDLDLSYYTVRHALEESGATFANATTVVQKVSRPATSVAIPARPGTYLIRAYDKVGVASVLSTPVVVRAETLETFTNTLTSTDSPTFLGTKTGCSVTSSQLRITATTPATRTATYTMSNYIDTGAVRRVRSRIDLNVNRFDANAGLWDSMPGVWDSWAGNWDDWTGGSQFDDTDVLTYISITEQDPAGTPTWSAYQLFKAGDFYGRAFRFQLVLKSSTVGVTPSISGLTARVQYN